jgi:hypothetical protein
LDYCLTYLDEEDGMSRFHLTKGEALNIEVSDSEAFKSRLPEIYDALVECSSFVNVRRVESGKPPSDIELFVEAVLKIEGHPLTKPCSSITYFSSNRFLQPEC